MYATLGIFSMNPNLNAEQRRELHEAVIPFVRARPAFVSGYWNLSPALDKSYAYLIWQTEAAARSFCDELGARPPGPNPHGVTLESVSVVELIASAQV